MSKPQPPTPPNPYQVAGAQGQMNVQSAIASNLLNQTAQSTPYGSVSYERIGSEPIPGSDIGIPQYRQNVTLSPEQQKIFDKSQGLQIGALDTGSRAIQNVSNTISNPFEPRGLPALSHGIPTGNNIKTSFENPSQQMSLGINDFSADRKKVEDALMSRFNEDIGKREADTISRLNAQGLQQGSEAYNSEMDTLNRARNDALTQAILGGGAEQSRLFDMTKQSGEFANSAAAQQFSQNQSAAGFNNAAQSQMVSENMAGAQLENAARQQGLQEQALLRSQPINEFATLFGLGSQVPLPEGAPQSGVGVNPADLLGATALQYNTLNNNYSQQMANKSANTAAAGSAAAAIGAAAIIF